VLVFVAACVLLACDAKRETGGEKGGTLIVGLLSEPATLNPLVATSVESHDVINMMFLKLLDEQSDFASFEPRLAESFEFSSDSLAITFTLRDGVSWHDGTPVTARDVRFSWELHVAEEIAWPHRHVKEHVHDVEVVDDSTVRFHFDTVYPYQLMDANDGVIVPQHVLAGVAHGDMRTAPFGRSPVGNGPFRLAQWVPGQRIELVRNHAYYDGERPFLDRVVFRFVPDMTTLVTLLKTGEIDCIESPPVDALDDLRQSQASIEIYQYPSRSMAYIYWNLENPVLQDRGVRAAIAMAIDRDAIIATAWAGLAEPWNSPMHPLSWAYDAEVDVLRYDPTEARRMLEQLGWVDRDGDGVRERDGVRLEIEMLTNQGVQWRADIVTMAQAQLATIGVAIKPQLLEFGTMIGRLLAGDYDACVMGAKAQTKPDLHGYWHSASVPRFNAQRYRNAHVDGLIERAQVEPDRRRARALWSEAQRVIYYDQGMCFIAVPSAVLAVNARFCDVSPNAISAFAGIVNWYVGEDCRR
jgi:peptide/nickel transport system substrate-binding protein